MRKNKLVSIDEITEERLKKIAFLKDSCVKHLMQLAVYEYAEKNVKL